MTACGDPSPRMKEGGPFLLIFFFGSLFAWSYMSSITLLKIRQFMDRNFDFHALATSEG